MSGWSCPHESDGLCERVRGAYCRPGMRGCVLAGKVEFPGGEIPKPEWPDHAAPRDPTEASRRPDEQ